MFPSKVWIYTDASTDLSKNRNGIGFVMINRHGDFLVEYGETLRNYTNNQAELIAIKRALEFVKQYDLDFRKVIIVSDNLYAVKVLRGKWKFRANKDLIDEIKEIILNCKCRISFLWVKGHSKNVFNDRADEIAKIFRCK